MATPEALIKYYDCLKDSFNKIQLKDNKTALINAALRPKIREELVKSTELLVSYLNYIQVFTLIYSDKFTSICVSIICPLFKENNLSAAVCSGGRDDNKDIARLVHDTVKEILKAKPELIEELVHCLVRFYPNIYSDDHGTFTNYLSNCLETCSYIRGEPLTNLVAKILDRINPPSSDLMADDEKSADIKKLIEQSYEMIYKKIEVLDKRQMDNFSAAILAAFTREFLASENVHPLNHLVLYICSLDGKLLDLLINLLWATFTNNDRPLEERRASVCFACSFLARASYVDLEKVLNYLETATAWCDSFLSDNDKTTAHEISACNQTNALFYVLFQSILYLITQRYREMYEVDSIRRLKKLNLDRFLNCALNPLGACDIEIEQRFREVSTLYDISSLKPIDKVISARKKRRNANDLSKRPVWRVPFKETDNAVPERIRGLYHNYYDHRNFTVYRE